MSDADQRASPGADLPASPSAEDVPLGRAGRRRTAPSHRPGPEPPPRRRGPRRLATAVGLVLLVAAAAVVYLAWAVGPPGASTVPVEFEIERGTGARTVATELHEHGLVRHPQVFLALLVWRGIDRRVGAGVYDLAPAMDAFEVADALARGGRPRTVRVVVPEGSRVRDVAARLEAAGLGEREAIAALATDGGSTLGPRVPDGVGAEGYLFPAVYEVPVGEDPRRTLARMVERFDHEVDDEVLERLDALGLDVHGWVTLASMIQAEAAGDHEMAIIAGVFLNRLDIGMPLQSDPTVAYGLGKDLPALDFPGGDFDVDHPWNTYTRTGLPVGPIGSPGRAALEAVLTPERTAPNGRAWLYFMHGSAGGAQVFRPNVDYDGHLRDVERYLRR